MKRILVTSLGTVNAGAVVASLRKMGGVEILGADINEARSIANARDVDAFYRFPSVVDAKETYVDFLKAFCVEKDVDGIFPFIDEEVLMLSEQKEAFAKLGVVVFVPDCVVVSLCHDKTRFSRWMTERFPAFAIPAFETRDDVTYPAFVKPREGRASIGCRRIGSRRELDAAIPDVHWNDFVVQPLITGRIVAADIVRSRVSGAVGVIQREELLRNGNGCGIAVELVDDEKVETFCRDFAEAVDLNGVVNAEFFLTDKGPKVIEVNPRLPAGTSYDCLAGFDVGRYAFDIGYGGGGYRLPTRGAGSAAASPAATRPSRRKEVSATARGVLFLQEGGMKRTFYDAHAHCAGREQGGFMVGLEGEPTFEGILPNADAARFVRDNADRYCFFRYVTKTAARSDEANREAGDVFLKFHPRRERYSPSEVVAAIRRLCPVAVMIDTLNEPYWQPYDYWTICRAFPDVAFVLPHAGGYLIRDFVKICHFQPNVWIDFSLTHTNFGSISRNPLPDVDELIDYALRSSFRNRILLGSDIPFFRQDEVVDYYERKNALDLLNGNFLHLFERLKDDCAKAQRGGRHDKD